VLLCIVVCRAQPSPPPPPGCPGVTGAEVGPQPLLGPETPRPRSPASRSPAPGAFLPLQRTTSRRCLCPVPSSRVRVARPVAPPELPPGHHHPCVAAALNPSPAPSLRSTLTC
jgi:hypothetical protein